MNDRRNKSPLKSKSGLLDLLNFIAAGGAECIAAENKYRFTRSGKSRLCSRALLELLMAEDLAMLVNGHISLTAAGYARLKRMIEPEQPFLVQHGQIIRRKRIQNDPIDATWINAAESPLAWLARRSGRSGRPLINAAQFAAGERLRAVFTRAGLTPRVTANWIAPVAQARRGSNGDAAAAFADSVLTAKNQLAQTLDAIGPEFSGLLLDVCCFLKGLEIVERERGWPQRTAKIVLGLALDRLARYYGITVEAKGPRHARMRSWQAADARPTIDGG